jgi:hypothetical protein
MTSYFCGRFGLSKRLLTDLEKEVLSFLLDVPLLVLESEYGSVQIRDKHDGDMGSVEFFCLEGAQRQWGGSIASAEYTDADGITVLIHLDVDQNKQLFELDFWKTDFSPFAPVPRGRNASPAQPIRPRLNRAVAT